MSKSGKKYRKAREQVSVTPVKSWGEALGVVVETKHTKFDESVDADIILGIDPAKGEQVVRGSVVLPHGTGKKLKVLVFAKKSEHIDQAKAAGADFVGLEDLLEKVQGGWTGFDVAVATPDVMGQVGKVAKFLGPRGLLPNAKLGTVTFEVAEVVTDIKRGKVSFRNDKSGALHITFGKVSFGADKLLENLEKLIKAVTASKPASSKGKFVKKITVSSTMGVGVPISPDEVA